MMALLNRVLRSTLKALLNTCLHKWRILRVEITEYAIHAQRRCLLCSKITQQINLKNAIELGFTDEEWALADGNWIKDPHPYPALPAKWVITFWKPECLDCPENRDCVNYPGIQSIDIGSYTDRIFKLYGRQR